MTVKKSVERGVVLLVLSGRMSLDRIPVLKEAIDFARKEEGHKRFVLNMLDITDISSTGIGMILSTFKDLQINGGGLALADISPVTEYVLDLARLDDVFPTYKTNEEAIASFGV